MKAFIVARAMRAALIGAVFAGAPLTAHAEIKNYEFQLVQPTVQAGADRVVTVRLVDKTTGKAVPEAVIFARYDKAFFNPLFYNKMSWRLLVHYRGSQFKNVI